MASTAAARCAVTGIGDGNDGRIHFRVAEDFGDGRKPAAQRLRRHEGEWQRAR